MKIEIRETTKEGLLQITTLDERWYWNQKENIYRPSSSWISSYYPKGIEFYKWLANKGWDESQAIKEEAGTRGSKVHQAVDALINGVELKITDKFRNHQTDQDEELTIEEWEAIISFQSWFMEVKPEVISTEATVENSKANYAGTMDLKCKINGVTYIVDYKTSQYIWPSHIIQNSSYKHADGNEDVDKLAILQLGYKKNKMGYKFTEHDDKYVLFLAARQMWFDANQDVSPKQKDYPMTLSLKSEPEKIQEIIENEIIKPVVKPTSKGKTNAK